MRSRIFFAAIAGFWLVMNFLLWRSQEGAHSKIGSAVPVDVVWDKILTAPDSSKLDIYDHKKKIGFCEWIATTGQALDKRLSEDYEPDGSISEPSVYELTFKGYVTVFLTNHVSFEMHIRLSTNQTWQDFHLNAKMRPAIWTWDIHGMAAAQKVAIKITSDNGIWQRTLNFSDFEHPETLLEDVGGVGGAALARAANLSLSGESPDQKTAGIQWEAHEDWMQFGHSKVRVYRLDTEILGQHIYVFTSRAGEILWIETLDKVTCQNEAFNHF